MSRQRPTILTFLGVLVGLAVAVSAALASNPGRRELNGTIWVANRGAHTIRGFDAATGDVVRDGGHAGRLATRRPRLREGQAVRRRGVRLTAGRRRRRRCDRRRAEPDLHGASPPPRARQRGRKSHRVRRVRHQQGRDHRYRIPTRCSASGPRARTRRLARTPASSPRTDEPCTWQTTS